MCDLDTGLLRMHIDREQYASGEEEQEVVHDWLSLLLEWFFSESIYKVC